jgi:O-antigen/teichoic acid export membrane protein
VEDNLKNRMIKGTAWSFVAKISVQAIQFISSIILARLLLPEHFGLIAMVTIITMLAQTLINSGFSASLTRQKELTDDDLSTIFYFNIVVALLLFATIQATAGIISDFYGEPQLVKIIRVLSFNVITYALTLVQRVQLRRALNFKKIFTAEISGVITGNALAIYTAVIGWGVNALLVQLITSPFVMLIVYWMVNPWKPGLSFKTDIFKKHWRFSSRLLLTSVINAIYQNIYSVIIGKLFNAGSLGFFSKARSLQSLPVKSITLAFDEVMFAGLSKIQDDNQKLKTSYRHIIRMISFIVVPLMALLASSADNFIFVLLGEKWMESSAYLRLFCVAGVFFPLNLINQKMFFIKGHSGMFFKVAMIKKAVLTVLVIIAALMGGVVYFVFALIIHSIFAYTLQTWFTNKYIGFGLLMQLKAISNILLFSGVIYIVSFTLSDVIPNELLSLILQWFGGMFTYLILFFVFNKSYLTEIKEYFTLLLRKE